MLTIENIIEQSTLNGQNIFTPSNMEVYNTKIHENIFQTEGNAFFVVSTKRDSDEDLEALGIVHMPISIGDFQTYPRTYKVYEFDEFLGEVKEPTTQHETEFLSLDDAEHQAIKLSKENSLALAY